MKKARKGRNQRKANAITQMPSQDMDHDIWQELPEELYESVLARLPIAILFTFRAVCRKWNALPSSSSFTKLLLAAKQERAHSPWFYIITNETMRTRVGAVYDSSLKKWHRSMVALFLPVASAGGLVCYITENSDTLCVCNPLTRSWRKLPAQSVKLRYTHMSFGMTLLSGNSGYKVLWVKRGGSYQVYDSTDNSWSLPQVTPSNVSVPLSLDYRSQAVSIDGTTLYFMRSNPDGLVSYDTVKGTWRQFRVPMPPHSDDKMVAECGGRIMLVGQLCKYTGSCVYIWELQMTKKRKLLWKEVDRMPNEWCSEFYRKYFNVTCLGNKGLLMISLLSGEMKLLVTYDPLRREWLKVPNSERNEPRILSIVPFYPCLTASA